MANIPRRGEFVYDHPFQWGSRRIGPDLAREGGKDNESVALPHFMNPPDVTPGSIMPSFSWMADEKLDFDSIPLRVHAMQRLGVPYTDEDRDHSIDNAKAQAAQIAGKIAKQGGPPGLNDRELIALIAYVQRLGTDLTATAGPPAAAPTSAPASPAMIPSAPAGAGRQYTSESGPPEPKAQTNHNSEDLSCIFP